MVAGVPKPGAVPSAPSWNEVEQLSNECQELLTDVNNFIATNFPELQGQTAVINSNAMQRDSFERNRRPKTPPVSSSTIREEPQIDTSTALPAVDRVTPTGVMGAVFGTMNSAKSAWASYEDEYQKLADKPYEGRGFDRYFTNRVEDRSNLRMRRFEENNFDNRYYDYQYLEHHLRENDDERLADRMRDDERHAEERAMERSMIDRDSSYDDDRRMELEMERRDDYRMNYEEE